MSKIVERFRDIESASLRVVATLQSTDYEIQYTRDDLAGTYDEEELNQAYQSMMANQVSIADFARVGTFGELDCQVLLFDDVIVFLLPSSRYDGVFASFDRIKPFPILEIAGQADEITHLLTADGD